MAFGTTPTSTTSLGTNQFPVSAVAVPGETGGNLTALEGGPESTDGNGNKMAPARVFDTEQSGYVSATSPPTATNAGSDTPYTFSSQVNRVIIQNNTSTNVNYAFDAVASAGSLVLAPGSMLVYPKKCTVLHLYTVATQNINGSAASNIVVLGAL